jgi:nitroimidazol reductase NimA-like FMN-containing flavoprotein (pyridoxamine 5'-phosphate oxidase superfamily)
MFHELSRDESQEILARNHFGRIAYTFHDRVGIEPIGYVFAHDRLYLRTQHGSKLETLAHHPWVAFEIDEIEGAFDWRSVIVHGTVKQLMPDGSEADQQTYEHALTLLRQFVPGTLEEGDPVPFRTVVLALYLTDVTGRSASTRSS